jgi:hypothetical protein
MLQEPWATLLFVILVPVIVQAVKFGFDKAGKPISVPVVQGIALVLSAGFVFLNGGFAGLALPVYAGDPIAFVSAILTLLIAAWGPVELLYRVVLKALFEKLGF